MSVDKSIKAIYFNEQCLSTWMMCAWLISQRKKLPFFIVVSGDKSSETFSITQSTLPFFKRYLKQIGLPIDVLLKECDGVFSLGTNYVSEDKDFMHVWGEYGAPYGVAEFHHLINASVVSADKAPVNLERYSFSAQLARSGKFLYPSFDSNTLLGSYDVGININVLKFIELLKGYCLDSGVILDGDKNIFDGKHLLLEGKLYPVDLFVDAKVKADEGVHFRQFSMPFNVDIDNELHSRKGVVNKIVNSKGVFTQLINDQNRSTKTTYVVGGNSSCYINAAALVGNRLHIGKAAFLFPTPLMSDVDKAFLSISLFDGIFPWNGDFAVIGKEYSRRCLVAFQHVVDNTQMILSALSPKMSDVWTKSESLKHKESLFHVRGRLPVYEYDYFDIRWQLWLLMGLGISFSSHDPLIQRISSSDRHHHLERVEGTIRRALQHLGINTAVTEG